MRNTAGRDLVAIIVIYVVYFGLLYLLYSGNVLIESFGVTPGAPDGKALDAEQYREEFNQWAFTVAGVSLLFALVWYCIGEWGMKAHRTSDGSKFITWLLLLALTAGTGLVAAMVLGPPAEFNAWIPNTIQILGAAGFFYIATVLFSPQSCKFTPLGSKTFRGSW